MDRGLARSRCGGPTPREGVAMRPGRATMVLTVLTAVAMLAGLRTDPAVAATVRHVATTGVDTGDCVAAPCRTIGYAITQSTSGDTISVAAGTYAEPVVIDRSLTIAGAGSASTFVDGGAGTVVTIGAPAASIVVKISRLTIQNGQAPSGGGIS